MPNLNKVMLMGNLTRDPELRYLPSNMAVVGIGLAVNRRWRNQQGEQQEETTFLDCEAFGKTAELLNQYLRKGRPVYLEGRLKLDQWQDRESGANRSKLKVIIENFQFIDSRGDGGGGARGGSGGNYGAASGGASGGGGYQRTNTGGGYGGNNGPDNTGASANSGAVSEGSEGSEGSGASGASGGGGLINRLMRMTFHFDDIPITQACR